MCGNGILYHSNGRFGCWKLRAGRDSRLEREAGGSVKIGVKRRSGCTAAGLGWCAVRSGAGRAEQSGLGIHRHAGFRRGH